MEIADLPALNASLNALASVFLVVGYILIRSGRRNAHKRCMQRRQAAARRTKRRPESARIASIHQPTLLTPLTTLAQPTFLIA